MLNIIDSTGFGVEVSQGIVLTMAIVPALIKILFYVLRSIGVYSLAKRAGIKSAYFAFIPCLWVYPVCKILKNERFLFDTYEKLAVLITVLFTVGEVINFVYGFLSYVPVIGYYLQGGTVSIVQGEMETYLMTGNDLFNPFDTPFINVVLTILEYTSIPFDLISVIITVFLYVAIFRKYWPQNYILATVLSCIGLFAPLVFAIRKKEPVDYVKYARDRYNTYYNPYGPNPYGRPQEPPKPRPNEDPFSEFSAKEDEPFSEFLDKNNKDRN